LYLKIDFRENDTIMTFFHKTTDHSMPRAVHPNGFIMMKQADW